MTDKTMNDNQEPKKTPMDIVAEQKLEKWLKDVGLDKKKEISTLDLNIDRRKQYEKNKNYSKRKQMLDIWETL